jgi:hypothetical protein
VRRDRDGRLAVAESAPDEPERRVPDRAPELVGERVGRMLPEEPLEEAVVNDPVAGDPEDADGGDAYDVRRGGRDCRPVTSSGQSRTA